MSLNYQGITDHIVSAIREKDALLEDTKRENAAMREAADAFLRAWEDDMGVETEQSCAENLALVLGGVTEPHTGRTEQRLSKSQLKRVSTQIDPLQFTWESTPALWRCYYDPEGPQGFGRTREDALRGLFNMCDSADGKAEMALWSSIVAAIPEPPDGTSSPKCARCGHTWPEHEATASNLLCPDESAKRGGA